MNKTFLFAAALLLAMPTFGANKKVIPKEPTVRELSDNLIESHSEGGAEFLTLTPSLVPVRRLMHTLKATRQFFDEVGAAIPASREELLKEAETMLDMTPKDFVAHVMKALKMTEDNLLGAFNDPSWNESKGKWGYSKDDDLLYKAAYIWSVSLPSWLSASLKAAMDAQVSTVKGVEVVKTLDTTRYNKQLKQAWDTVDVDFNIIEGSGVNLQNLEEQLYVARRTYKEYGIQIRLRNARILRVPADWLKFGDPRKQQVPEDLELKKKIGYYAHEDYVKETLQPRAMDIFTAIVSGVDKPEEAIQVVTIRTLKFVFEGVEYGTSAMSFPSYILADRVPAAIRGVISISPIGGTNEKPRLISPMASTLAHEMGHKLANVSHEGRMVTPQNETTIGGYRDVMVYGFGLGFPSGEAGRWQAERLAMSPWIYRLDINGNKVWNAPYKTGGNYTDPLYGNFYIPFKAAP
jgi:hypothetical protein